MNTNFTTRYYQLQLDVANISGPSIKVQESFISVINSSLQFQYSKVRTAVFIKDVNDFCALFDGQEILATSRFHCN